MNMNCGCMYRLLDEQTYTNSLKGANKFMQLVYSHIYTFVYDGS